MKRKLRRYQLYVDGRYHGFEEGWDLTGRVAISRLVAEIFGNDAAMRLKFDGNSAVTVWNGRRYQLRAMKV